MVTGLRLPLLLALLLLLAACGTSSKETQVRKAAGFVSPPTKKVLYVVPFLTVMVPPEVEEGIFDLFVDSLNAGGQSREYDFVILKEGLDRIDAEWLAQQDYLTGEIYGYVEDSGCCSTAIRVKSRLQLHQTGHEEPTLTIEYPREIFFEHDYSTLEQERRKLAEEIATTLATRLLAAI